MKNVFHLQAYKTLLVLAIMLAGTGLTAQAEKKYLLEWRINPDEYLCYHVIQYREVNEAAHREMAHDLYKMLRSKDMDPSELKDTISEEEYVKKSMALQSQIDNNAKMYAIIRNVNLQLQVFIIKIEEYTDENEQPRRSGRVTMLGSINAHGHLQNSILSQPSEAFISQLFELPEKQVMPGDSWSIDATYSPYREQLFPVQNDVLNSIMLNDIYNEGKDQIASLTYTLSTRIKGTQLTFFDNTPELDFQNDYSGVAEFNISQGRWKTYSTFMSMKYNEPGSNFDNKIHYLLEEVEVPKDVKAFLTKY